MKKADVVFEPSPEHADRVSLLAGAGVPEARIAAAVGCSLQVLKKVFAPELQCGRDRMLAAALENLHTASARGSAAASRALIGILRREPASPGPKPPLPPRRRYLGEREAAMIAAQDAHRGTEWSHLIPDPPKPKSRSSKSKKRKG